MCGTCVCMLRGWRAACGQAAGKAGSAGAEYAVAAMMGLAQMLYLNGDNENVRTLSLGQRMGCGVWWCRVWGLGGWRWGLWFMI